MDPSLSVNRTRTNGVYDQLRTELLSGVISPGEKLKLVELAERFGVSQSVVREALTRLAEQGLAVATPQRGFRVRELSISDIAELTEARVKIETSTLCLSIERGGLAWETDVLTTHHVLEHTPVTFDDGTFNEEWPAKHREFHRALLAGSGNSWLQSLATSLRDNSELYRRWYWVLADDHQRDIVAEHQQLKDFALAHDPAACTRVFTDHIKRAPSQLIAYARERGVQELHKPQVRGT
jgi:DNA-binding GntR family transcriptional regulator